MRVSKYPKKRSSLSTLLFTMYEIYTQETGSKNLPIFFALFKEDLFYLDSLCIITSSYSYFPHIEFSPANIPSSDVCNTNCHQHTHKPLVESNGALAARCWVVTWLPLPPKLSWLHSCHILTRERERLFSLKISFMSVTSLIEKGECDRTTMMIGNTNRATIFPAWEFPK